MPVTSSRTRGLRLFLLVLIPVGLFVALNWSELSVIAGPVMLAFGAGMMLMSLASYEAGGGAASSDALLSGPLGLSLIAGGLVLATVGVLVSLWQLTQLPPLDKALHAALTLLCQGVGFLVMGGLLLAILPRFVLPTQTPAERRRVRSQIWRYLLGQPTAAVFIRNGEPAPPPKTEEAAPLKPTVVLLDLVSAVALERQMSRRAGSPAGKEEAPADAPPSKATPLVRIEGPGLVFIEPGEVIRSTLDLRTQVRDRQNIHALTRDGIEVWATLEVTFRLQEPKPQRLTEADTSAEERNLFKFNRESAFRAVYGSPVSGHPGEGGETEVKRWTDLPAFVASDIFRDLMLEHTLDDLFHPTSDQTLPLEDVRKAFDARVKRDSVLSERGIRVLSAGFGRLSVPGAVESQRLDTWKADWTRQSVEMLAGGDLQTLRIIQRARADAQYELVARISAVLHEAGSNVAVWLRFIESVERASADPTTRRLLPGDTVNLIRNWIDQFSRWLPHDPALVGRDKLAAQPLPPGITDKGPSPYARS